MNSGMLWFGGKLDTVGDRLVAGVAAYEDRYGRRPTMCEMHPTTFANFRGDTCGVRLVESNRVLPHHFWLGEESA